jgi:hypothetical protein
LSRNKDRLGGTTPPNQELPPVPEGASDGGGFSFVVPTDMVDLPSKGKFYPPNHPLYNVDTIELKQMTAKEEDLLTSRSLLKKGVVLDRLLQSVIIDKKIKPEHLLVGDRNAIVIAVRIAGYGSEYTTSITCPACSHKQKKTFDLFNYNMHSGDETGEIVTNNNDGSFTTTLPKTGLEVNFRLMTGRDEKSLTSGMKQDRQKNSHEQNITRQLRSMLLSVNGNSTSQALNYLIDNIPSLDSRHLRMAYKSAAPNVELKDNFICEACDHEQEMEVPLTADFFWPDR